MQPPENHMVLPSATPAEYEHDAPEPKYRGECVVCKKPMASEDGCEWWDGDTVTEDGDGADRWLRGETLSDAEETPAGMVCSLVCKSQAMYQHATPAQREGLDRMLDALTALNEYLGDGECDLLNSFGFMGTELGALAEQGARILSELQDPEPKWMNRMSREAMLERSIRRADLELEFALDRVGAHVRVESVAQFSDEYRAAEDARLACKIGNARQMLRGGTDEL